MIEKEKLREYAHKLMFDMKDEEYETLKDRIKILEIQNERYRKMAEKF